MEMYIILKLLRQQEGGCVEFVITAGALNLALHFH